MSTITRYIKRWYAIWQQSKMDTESLRTAKKIIIFLLPPTIFKAGGILSIFSCCKASRALFPNDQVILATFPGKNTYARVSWFDNDENIYRFSQVVNDAIRPDRLYIHVPEYLADTFFSRLSASQKKHLKNIPELHINIMNQNVELMPPREKLKELFELTNKITQTAAHKRYATQTVCDQWGIPLHHLNARLGMPQRTPTELSLKKKDKIIALSSDQNVYRDRIVAVIKNCLPDYRIVTVENMSYEEYFSLISKSMFVITFGEGFDAYLIQPFSVKTIGLSVYNETFFPGKEWAELKNIYSSYEEMEKKLVSDVRCMENDETIYSELIIKNRELIVNTFRSERYEDRLMHFYKEEYDFLPTRDYDKRH